MRTRLRRFAAVGLVTTVVDVGTLLLLARAAHWPVALADAVALAVAAGLSFVLHRGITFHHDPHVRWVEVPSAFVATAVAAGVVDIAVLQVFVSSGKLDDGLGLFWVKLPAVAVAAAVRLVAYRLVLFTVIRRDLAERRPRPPAPGDLRLSVVIPAFGEADTIGATIARVRRELAAEATEGGLEVVVVDDGSPDDTAEAARVGGA
ncbi:MAG TPA: GtrA family protein, partial [Acidimicrobiales bacterium]